MGDSWIAIFTRNDISTVSTSKESCFQCHLTVSAESGHLFAADYHYDVLRLFKRSSLKQNSWYLHSYVEFSEIIRQKSLSGFYAISQRTHCMTLQFLNLDTLHQRLRIHSYVTGCWTERVWGGGGGVLIIAFSSWPGLLVLNMCIVRLYLKTFSNHQTVFVFKFVSMKFSDSSTGAFNRKLTCWGHQISQPQAPWFVFRHSQE